MSKVRILSPRPENSNRRKCGGFNFFGDACGFKRQTAVCRGSNLSLDLSSKDDKSACILVFMRTAQGLFLYTRIRPDHPLSLTLQRDWHNRDVGLEKRMSR